MSIPSACARELASIRLSSDREVQESIIDPEQGRNMASVTRIKGVGHLVKTALMFPHGVADRILFQVVQEAPKKLADVLFAILQGAPPGTTSKL